MVRPVFGFFFSWRVLSAQPVSGAHTVQLADTHRETEALSHEALDLAACDRRVVLAVIQHTGKHLPAEFDRVTVAPLDEGVFAFTLHTLEEPVHGAPMHRNGAAPQCL
jgi:hypothetical protein